MTEFVIRPGEEGFHVLDAESHQATTDGIAGLAYMLLFTWRRAEEGDEIPDGITSKQGFWGNKDLGCKWWLRVRLICNDDSLQIIKRDAEEALSVLLDLGVVSAIHYEVWRFSETVGFIRIRLVEPDGKETNLVVEDIWKVIRNNG